MKRETANVLLVLLGGALLKIAWNGSYLRYVKPSLLPFLVATGIVICALGVLAIIRDIRRAGDAVDHEHGGRSQWLLLAPVLAIFLVAPPALGADKVSRSAQSLGAQDRASYAYDPLPPGAITELAMGDFVSRAVWDSAGTLDGRQVRLTGFAVRGQDGELYLARLTIACCAADALPVQVRLDGAGASLAGVAEDDWLQVDGALVRGSATAQSRFVPALRVSAVRPVAAPAETYEY